MCVGKPRTLTSMGTWMIPPPIPRKLETKPVGFANSSAALRGVELGRFGALVVFEGGLISSCVAVLRRQLARSTLTRADRVLLASLSRSLTRSTWASFLVRPDTLLRWHRQPVARRWTYPHRKPGKRPLEPLAGALILRLAKENPHLGYRRIVGELKGGCHGVADDGAQGADRGRLPASTGAGGCRGERSCASRRRLRWPGTSSPLRPPFWRIYVLFFISLATRRIEYVACTPNPEGGWTAQQARNLLMQLGDLSRSGF